MSLASCTLRAVEARPAHQLLVASTAVAAHNSSAHPSQSPPPFRKRHVDYLLPEPAGLDPTEAQRVHAAAVQNLRETWTPLELAEMFHGKAVYRLPEDGPALVVREDAVWINPRALAAPDAGEALGAADMTARIEGPSEDVLLATAHGADLRSYGDIAEPEAQLVRDRGETEWPALREATGTDPGLQEQERMRAVLSEGMDPSLPEEDAINLFERADGYLRLQERTQTEVPDWMRKLRRAERHLTKSTLDTVSGIELFSLAEQLPPFELTRHLLDLEDRLRVQAVKHKASRLALEEGDFPGESLKDRRLIRAELQRSGQDHVIAYHTHALQQLLTESKDLAHRQSLDALTDEQLLVLERELRSAATLADLEAVPPGQLEPYVHVVEKLAEGNHLSDLVDDELTQVSHLLDPSEVGDAARKGNPWQHVDEQVTERLEGLRSQLFEEQIRRHF